MATINKIRVGETTYNLGEGGGGGSCEWCEDIAQFFGIEGTFEAEAVGQETTNNPVIDECKVRYAECFDGLLPSGFVMPNSVTIDGTTYTGTTNE